MLHKVCNSSCKIKTTFHAVQFTRELRFVVIFVVSHSRRNRPKTRNTISPYTQIQNHKVSISCLWPRFMDKYGPLRLSQRSTLARFFTEL